MGAYEDSEQESDVEEQSANESGEEEGPKDLRQKLLSKSPGEEKSLEMQIVTLFNKAVIISWPLFSFFLLSQPWVSNWMNNSWHSYSAEYDVYGSNGTLNAYPRSGMCVTPASEMHCTDGQNFTELALKYRGAAVGCGCGQGVLGEGLCPMTSYGYTLSDFVSTSPAIAAMLGFGFFPIIGTWVNTMMINELAQPRAWIGYAHYASMLVFQISFIIWSIASDCIFPVTHAVLTVVFLGAFLGHWVITAMICVAKWGFDSLEASITFFVAVSAIVIITGGAIPRVFLSLNSAIGSPVFPNWNRGIGSYAFWFAEAAGLSLTFGAYPMVVIGIAVTNSDEKTALLHLSTNVGRRPRKQQVASE